MDVADLVLPSPVTIGGWVVALPLGAWAAWRTDWMRLARGASSNLLFGGIFILVMLWSLRGTIGDGLAFHLLGSAGLALVGGLPAALGGGALVVAITTLLRDAPLANAALVWLTLVAIPAATACAWLSLLERLLPSHFFVYIFGGCFLGGAISHLAAGLAGVALAAASPSAVTLGDYMPVLVAVAFAESTLTGMMLTLAVVYRPESVATFDDARYLGRSPDSP